MAPDLSIHHPRRALEEFDGAQSGSAMPVSFVLHVGCPGPMGVVPAALRGSSQSFHFTAAAALRQVCPRLRRSLAGSLWEVSATPGTGVFWTSTGWTVSLGLFSPTSCLATVAFFFNYLRGVRSAFLCTLLV